MTIEIEHRNLIGKTTSRTVLEPGRCVVLERHALIGPDIHVQAISEDQVEVIKLFPGNEIQRQTLTQDEINKSGVTRKLFPGLKLSWKPSLTG